MNLQIDDLRYCFSQISVDKFMSQQKCSFKCFFTFFFILSFSISSQVTSLQFNKVLTFLSELKRSFDQSKLQLTTTIVVSDSFVYTSYNLPELSKSMESINFVLDYKQSAMIFKIDHAINLLSTRNVQNKIGNLISSGVPPVKIVMSVHFTGPGFVKAMNGHGEDLKFQTIYGYDEICNEHPLKWQKSYTNSKLAILKSRGNDNITVLIESSRSIANKVRFAVKHSLAGVVAMHVPVDDYHGKCAIEKDIFEDFKPANGAVLSFPTRNDTTFPFLRTINEAIKVAVDEIRQESDSKIPLNPSQGNGNENGAATYSTSNSLFMILTLFGTLTSFLIKA